MSKRFSSEMFLSACLCGCLVLSKPKAKEQILVYLSVGLPVGLCPGDFLRKGSCLSLGVPPCLGEAEEIFLIVPYAPVGQNEKGGGAIFIPKREGSLI